MAAGVLVAVQASRVETGVVADDGFGDEALGERDEHGLPPRLAARLAGDEARDARIVEAWANGRGERRHGPTVVVAVDDGHARALAERFEAAGFSAAWVPDAQPRRLSVFDRFRNGAFDVLVTADPVPEGVELPGADTVLLCRPIASEGSLAALCAPVLRGRAWQGTKSAHVVAVEDRWEHLTGWVDTGRLLTPAST